MRNTFVCESEAEVKWIGHKTMLLEKRRWHWVRFPTRTYANTLHNMQILRIESKKSSNANLFLIFNAKCSAEVAVEGISFAN